MEHFPITTGKCGFTQSKRGYGWCNEIYHLNLSDGSQPSKRHSNFYSNAGLLTLNASIPPCSTLNHPVLPLHPVRAVLGAPIKRRGFFTAQRGGSGDQVDPL